MAYFTSPNVSIEAIACCLPKQQGSVEDYCSVFGETAVQKFTAMTGVKNFYRCPENQTASDLGFAAAERIFELRGIERESIGALIFVSQFPDYRRPATACVLHKRLGLKKDCIAYDINLGCSSYVYGLHALSSLMESSDVEYGLLINCDSISKTLPEKDPGISILFGDAGSATLLAKVSGSHSVSGMLRTIGAGFKAIIYPPEGFRNRRISSKEFDFPEGIRKTLNQSHMNGRAVFEFTITEVPKLIKDFLAKAEREIASYDAVIFHQANLLILKQLERKFKLSDAVMPISIDCYGNTSGVSLPLTLCHAVDQWEKPELNVLFCGFGIGLSLGAVEARIKKEAILGIIHSSETFPEGVINKPEDLLM